MSAVLATPWQPVTSLERAYSAAIERLECALATGERVDFNFVGYEGNDWFRVDLEGKGHTPFPGEDTFELKVHVKPPESLSGSERTRLFQSLDWSTQAWAVQILRPEGCQDDDIPDVLEQAQFDARQKPESFGASFLVEAGS